MSLNASSLPIAQHDCVLPTCGLRVRIFYPCVASDGEAAAAAAYWMPVSFTKWSDENTLAYAEYLGLPFARIFSYIASWITRVRLPWNADVAVARQPVKFPVALFSHGLGSNLGGYVSVCADIARHTERIVVAVEHADGSAHAAYVGSDSNRKRIPFEHNRDRDALENRSKQQLRQRLDEFKAVVRDLRLLNDGTAKQTALPPHETVVDFSRRIDLAVPIVVAGHSFGSSTAFGYALQNPINVVSHVICLDPWLSPIPPDILGGGYVDPTTQVLHVDQEQTGITDSVILRDRFASPYKRVCVVGGVHNNATDFATKLPSIIAVAGRLAAKRINPEHLMRAQNQAVVQFINGHWDAFESEVRDGKIHHLKL